MTNSEQIPSFFAVDFYCGAGGTTRGLLDSGGYIIAGIDNDEGCSETYRLNNRNTTLDGAEPAFLAFDMFPASEDYPQGQQQEVWDELENVIPHYRKMAPDVPLMFAICAPCQSFTKFIQRRMTDDRTAERERDRSLLQQTVGFIQEFQPEMVISENVASIRNGQYQFIWSEFQQQLRDLGYAVGENVVCASDFGVPQYRRRSVLLAFNSKPRTDFALDTVVSVPDKDLKVAQVSASEALKHLPSLEAGTSDGDIANHVCRNLIEKNRQRLQSVKPGEPNFGFADTRFGDLSLPCHRRLADKGKRGFGDVYTRMHPDRPAPTITTRFHSISNGRFGHYDETQVRGLSLREGAALQSFPDDYQFYGVGMDSIARMIGNAVPPRLSAYMARWLLGFWSDADRSSVAV